MSESPSQSSEFSPGSPPPSSSPPAAASPPPLVVETPPPSSSPPPASPPPPSSSPPPPSSSPPPSPAALPPPTPSQPTPSSPSPPTTHNVPTPAIPVSPPPPNSVNPRPIATPPPPGSTIPESRAVPSHSRPQLTPGHAAQGSDAYQVVVVIGLALGLGLILLVALLLFYVCSKKKKKPLPSPMPYYGSPPNGNGLIKNSNTPSPAAGGYRIQVPPPPGAAIFNNQGAFGSNTWGATPPGVVNSSGELISPSVKQCHNNLQSPQSPLNIGFNKPPFSYEELSLATDGFSQANLLGKGGFGYVHKGVLPNGKEVAVKSLKAGSGQGEREFQAEVEIISRVHHRYLVTLVGYCISGEQRMLVYEFVPNNTLEFHLHGEGRPPIEWRSRVKIALGSAKGLAYLHEDCHPRIIHRDIKSANILLDFNFDAKVADFGLAKLSSDTCTHVSTRIMGTFGYLAPEYASTGKLTDKSDVFSFGVVLLELITGRRPVDISNKHNMEDSLVDWARPVLARAMEDGDFSKLADPRLERNYDHQEMMRLIACAASCIRHSARRRARMSQIVRVLEGDVSLNDLNEIKDGRQNSMFSSSSPSSGGGASDVYDTACYNAEIQKFRKLALESQAYASSEFGVTSEYGLNPSSSSSDDSGTEHNSPDVTKNSNDNKKHVSFIHVSKSVGI